MDVTAISSGDYVKVKNVDFGSGGSIQVRLGSQTDTLVGTCTVAATGGTQIWANTICTVSGASGVKDVFFVFSGGPFNFDNWRFTGTGGGSGTGGSGGTSANGSSVATGGVSSVGTTDPGLNC
jgi:hypothetical protein